MHQELGIILKMKQMLKFFYILLLLLLFTSCSSQTQNKELKIATNSWIGYAPLFYAQEKGELKKLNIKLIQNVSLGEAADTFSIGKADLVTTTQHEYFSLNEAQHKIIPIILLDRSNGGDMILSNKTLQEIKEAKKIYAYLEIDSINKELLQEFIQKQGLKEKNIIFINKDQAEMQDLNNDASKTILIVTYSPYNISFEKKNFHELASTRDLHSLVVIDALCIKKSLYKENKMRIQKLKKVVDNAIEEMQKNPKASYQSVKNHLDNISYKEYVESLNIILWINHPDKELLQVLKKMQYETKFLAL